MSEAFKCDRCENYLDASQTSSKIETTLIRGDVELCRSCVNQFKRFIKYNKDLR